MAVLNESTRPKNIVLCSDGTGNRGGIRPTNVWRTYLAVDTKSDSPQQVRIHDDGVGTDDFLLLKIAGGAFGVGIGKNIRQLYAALIQAYAPGDRIYLFGFSRGAYTVRILAQLVCLFGVPDGRNKTPSEIDLVAREILSKYKRANVEASSNSTQPAPDPTRGKYRTSGWKSKTARAMQTKHGNLQLDKEVAGQADSEYPIHFLGVWDTVSAIGLPFDELTRAASHFFRLRFRSNDLNHGVHHAYQALSIDDERRSFHPELWNESAKSSSQTIEQVWFPGVHSNVGGGYPKDEVALVALNWMLDIAEKHGLQFHEELRKQYRRDASEFGKMYNSRAGLKACYRYLPRRIDRLCGIDEIARKARNVRAKARIHVSALNRIEQRTESYAPMALTIDGYMRIGDGDETEQSISTKHPKYQTQIEHAHDFGFMRRSAYYGFLSTTVLFLWSALSVSSEKPPTGLLGSIVGKGVDLAGLMLPSFLKPILQGLRAKPMATLSFAGVLLSWLLLNGLLRSVCRDTMSAAWFQETESIGLFPGIRLRQKPIIWLAKVIAPFRRNKTLRKLYMTWEKYSPTIVTGLLAILIVYWVFTRAKN